MAQSKNYERYAKWFKDGSITEEQLDRLVKAKLLTKAEKEILNGDREEELSDDSEGGEE